MRNARKGGAKTVIDTQKGSRYQRMAVPERRSARRLAQAMVAGGVLVLGSSLACPALAAPTQEPEATIAITPSPVAGGSDIAVDGSCPAGTAIAAITLYMSIGDHVMYYREDLPAAPDGSFAVTVTLPTDAEAGMWTGVVDCDEAGAVAATTTFAVTGDAPPMSFRQEDPVDLTDGLTLSGVGCTAGDVPLATVSIDVFGYDGTTVALLGSATATAAANGSWTATVMLPPPAGADEFGLATVECSSGDGTGWARYAEMPVSLAPFAQATTTTTAPPTPTTAPRVLVRTGPSPAGGSLAAVGVALVACGALVRRGAARRRPALS